MMRKLIAFCLFMATIFTVNAQKKGVIIPEDDRNTCFLYAEAESPVNPNVKILIVSSYIYRKKYKTTDASDKLSNASSNYFDGITKPFLQKIEEIVTNERVFVSGIAKDIVFDDQIAKSFKSSVYADGHCPISADEQLKIPQYTSTKLFSKACRNRLIRAKRDQGYRIFQVTFDEYYETRDSYDQLWTNEHHKQVVDQVEKISPLEVEPYRPGAIKNLPNYKSIPSSNYKMPGLIVSSSSNDRSSSNSKSTSTSSSTTSTTSDNDVTIYNNVFAAENARKYNEQKAMTDLVTGVFDLFAASPEKLEREQKQREYAQIAATRDFELGEKLIKENLAGALKGDSLSIVNTYQGYFKTKSREVAMQFVTKIHEKHHNKTTSSILQSIYKLEEDRFNSEISLYQFDRRTNKAYTYMVLGGAVAMVPLLFKKELVAKHGENAGTATYILAGAGGVSILAAVIAKLSIPQLSSKTRYHEAIEGLKEIKAKKIQASFVPTYNLFENTPMLGVNIKF